MISIPVLILALAGITAIIFLILASRKRRFPTRLLIETVILHALISNLNESQPGKKDKLFDWNYDLDAKMKIKLAKAARDLADELLKTS